MRPQAAAGVLTEVVMFSWLPRTARGWLLLLTSLGLVVAVAFSVRYPTAGLLGRLFQAGDRRSKEAVARARGYLQKGQLRRAIQEVSRVPSGAPDEAEALTIRGFALANMEEVGPAREVLERAWRLRPSAMAAKTLAAIYLSANETERGLRVLEMATRLDPDDFRPWYAMGESVYLRARRYDKAASAFREALKRLPDHLESRIGLVEALVKSHHPHEAEPLLEGLLKDRPDNRRVLLVAVGLAMEMDRSEEAARTLAQILALDPENREALLLRARSEFRAGQAKSALADGQRALALEPNDLAALYLVGSIQSAIGMKAEAAQTLARRREVQKRLDLIKELSLEIEKRPKDPAPRWRLGRVAALAGMRRLAAQSFEVALALAPDCKEAREGLLELGLARARERDSPAAERAGKSTGSSSGSAP